MSESLFLQRQTTKVECFLIEWLQQTEILECTVIAGPFWCLYIKTKGELRSSRFTNIPSVVGGYGSGTLPHHHHYNGQLTHHAHSCRVEPLHLPIMLVLMLHFTCTKSLTFSSFFSFILLSFFSFSWVHTKKQRGVALPIFTFYQRIEGWPRV